MDTIVKNYLQKFGVSEATQTFLGKAQKMFIGGAFVDASDGQTSDVIEPSTAGLITRIPMGTTARPGSRGASRPRAIRRWRVASGQAGRARTA